MRLSALLALAGAAATLAAPAAHAQPIRTQAFDADPGWASLGSGAGGNSFGYRTSANAGGTGGEAGGRFTRSTTLRYYADTALGGTMNLGGAFSASGKFDVTAFQTPDVAIVLGHFRPSGFAHAGIVFNYSGASLIARVSLRLDDAAEFNGSNVILNANVDRLWSYDWNPTGGTFGGGRLAMTIRGPGGVSQFIDLTPAQRAAGASFEGFGLSAFPNVDASPAMFGDVYIDDVSYTVVPEPSLLALATTLVVFGGTRYLRRRSTPKSAVVTRHIL